MKDREALIDVVLDVDTGLPDVPWPREQAGMIVDAVAPVILASVRRRLTALKRALPRLDGPGDVDDALRAILSELDRYPDAHQEEPGRLEGHHV